MTTDSPKMGTDGCRRIFIALVACLCIARSSSADVAIFPAEFTLDGANAQQQLLACTMSEGAIGAAITEARFASSDVNVVTISEEGIAIPVGNGSATITSGDAIAKVTVTGFDTATTWSFSNHVLPVLAKADCNSGGCHGALAGKGGFRLSLRGYAPMEDYHAITRDARGRRIELGDPGRSLVLAKPTTAIKHKGGKKLEVGTRNYRVLSEWIAAGARPPQETDATLEAVEVLPEASVLKKGDRHRIIVRARYSDGRVEDVTSWAKFASTDETVARVGEDGQISVVGNGEGAVTAWFSSQIAIARIRAPYPVAPDPSVFASSPRHNFIDDHVLAQLQRLNLPPSQQASDHEFIRRAFLDTIGLLPTPDEVRAFAADERADKREHLVDSLLARPEFVDYWTYRWSDVLLISGNKLRPNAVKAYYDWVRSRVAADTPWDKFVREILTAKGSSTKNGATNFFAVHQDPETMAENVSQAFMSLSIGCAKCHNHPLEKWTNDQYYAFANLFSRVRAKGWGGEPRSGDGERTLYVSTKGELLQPNTGKPQKPAPLDGAPLELAATGDRREYLADWLTAPENPYFARAVTNRVWANFFAVGLVEPVDDLRASNPSSNEALLNAASAFLVAKDYDLKSLMRLILNSAAYQRSSKTLPGNSEERRYYARYYPRRLMAEVLHDAIAQVSDVPGDFTRIAFPGGEFQNTSFYPKGTRAIQLFDSAVASYFLKAFGRNERAITCECERSNEPSMVQVLHLSNGTTINEKLKAKESRLEKLVAEGADDGRIVDEAYLWALSRTPTAREKAEFSEILAEAKGDAKREAVEDLFWALMSSREFLFNH